MSDTRIRSVHSKASRPTAGAILGNWRLSGFTVVCGDAIDHPLGKAPMGNLSYDPDGRMSVYLCKGPGAMSGATMPDFTAYCGRYTLDAMSGTLVHHIEAGSLPQLAGTDQTRHFQLDDDRLTLSAQTTRGETVLEWQRSGDAPADMDAPPPGFVPLETPGVFSSRAGRFYVRDRDGTSPVVGTRIGPDQSNSEGFAHGGFLLTFADFAMTVIVQGITLNLSADFIRSAQTGDWVEAQIITRKRTANLVFADAVATCGGRDVLRIGGLFKPFEKLA